MEFIGYCSNYREREGEGDEMAEVIQQIRAWDKLENPGSHYRFLLLSHKLRSRGFLEFWL